MTVECITCDRFSLRASADMARQGFGACSLPTTHKGRFVSPDFPRECASHKPADADQVAARREWLAKRRPSTSSS